MDFDKDLDLINTNPHEALKKYENHLKEAKRNASQRNQDFEDPNKVTTSYNPEEFGLVKKKKRGPIEHWTKHGSLYHKETNGYYILSGCGPDALALWADLTFRYDYCTNLVELSTYQLSPAQKMRISRGLKELVANQLVKKIKRGYKNDPSVLILSPKVIIPNVVDEDDINAMWVRS